MYRNMCIHEYLDSHLSTDLLATADETGVLLAALVWLEQDYSVRRQYEDTVLDCVRFPLLPENVLLTCFEREPKGRAALQNLSVRTKLTEAAM